jgi:iron(III) transport system permease protein
VTKSDTVERHVAAADTSLRPSSGLLRLRPALVRLSAAHLVGIGFIAVTAWLVVVPLAGLFVTAFSEDTPYGPGEPTLHNFVEAYSSWHLPQLFWTSFVFATGSAVLTLLMGGLVAWAVERTDMPGRGLFHSLTLLTFAIPGLLTTMAWTLTLSPNIGWVNGLLRDVFGLSAAPFNIYSMGGMIWALSTHYFPLAYLLLGPAFRTLDMRMEEAALMAGAHQGQILRRVTLPLMRPAILSALLLLFIRGIESFEVPRILGTPARIEVFTTDIAAAIRRAPPEFGIASALSLTLLSICILAVYLYRRAVQNAEAFATITGKGYTPTPFRLGRWRWPAAIAIGTLFAISLGLPLFTLLWQSLFAKMAQPFVATAEPVTAANYKFVLSYPIFAEAVRTSVTLGAMAATLIVAITFVIAWIAQRIARRYGWLLDLIAFMPIAVPSVIIGASVLFAYLILPIPVYNTIWILLIAYLTAYLPYGIRFASGGIAQLHKELEEAGKMAGAGYGQIFLRILLPLLAPVAISAWLYIFVLAVRELGASLMLVGPGTHVLGTITLTMWEEGGSYGAVCALGVIQIVPLIAIVAVLRSLEKRMARSAQGAARMQTA